MKTITITNVTTAINLKDKIIGLLNTAEAKPIFFQTRWGIHTFGMKYPIDVLILDDQYIIKDLRQNLKPWRLFTWNPIYQYVIELPSGMIKNKSYTKNCKVILKF